MNRLSALLAAVALLAACGQTTARPAAGFRGMSAVAVFKGYLNERPAELRSYVATANPQGDELKFVDAIDDRVVLAPAPIGPLSLPTLPRPAFLAAISLADVDGTGAPAPQADLLVVASRSPQSIGGAPPTVQLELVATWDPETHVAATVDLGAVAPDANLLALLAAPVPQPAGADHVATPGRARVLAALSGGRLATVEFARTATGAIEQASAVVVQDLGFVPLALAAGRAGRMIYVATSDPIPGPGGTLGVAELDASGTPGAFAVRALDARGPTVAVTTLEVSEFVDFTGDPTADEFTATPAPRVYAALAPSSCGRDAAMPCGVVVLDPVAGGILPDPAGLAEFMTPIQVPGIVTALAATGPSAVPEVPGRLRIAPGSGQRLTTGLIVASSTTGRAYLIDPGHFAIPSDTDLLRGGRRTRVAAFRSERPVQPTGEAYEVEFFNLGIWDERVATAPVVTTSVASVAAVVGLTPGFTNSETWSVTWQGILPGLGGRRAELRLAPTGVGEEVAPSWLAIQDRTGLTGPGGEPVFRDVGRLYDPLLAIRLDDLVVVDATAHAACGQDEATGRGGLFELRITAILPPSAAFPGGAVSVAPAAVQPANVVRDANGNLVFNADGTVKTTIGDPTCVKGLGAGELAVTSSVRASRLVISGSVSGYAGRPEVVDSLPETAAPFQLAWQDERTLPACPVLLEPGEAWPPSPAAIAACEGAGAADQAACRAACEQVILSRRARRLYYVTDQCLPLVPPPTSGPTTDCGDSWPGLTFPYPTGPALSFKLGVVDGAGAPVPTDPPPPVTLVRDTTLTLTTANGIVPTSREPYAGTTVTAATQPTQAAWFDRGAATLVDTDSVHGMVGFGEGVLVDFGPAQAAPNAKVIR